MNPVTQYFQKPASLAIPLLCAVLMSACASDYVANAIKQRDANIVERSTLETVKPDEGAVGFTVLFESPSAGSAATGLLQGSKLGAKTYQIMGKKATDGLFGNAYWNSFEANQTHTVFIKFAPSDYQFHKIMFGENTSNSGELVLSKPIAFTVKRGELNYLGHIHFKLPPTSFSSYSLQISNQAQLFMQNNSRVIQASKLKVTVAP